MGQDEEDVKLIYRPREVADCEAKYQLGYVVGHDHDSEKVC